MTAPQHPESVEIEAKMSVSDAVRTAMPVRLARLGAKHLDTVLETNIFLDDATRSLLARDEGLRVRIERSLIDSRVGVRVTWKGARRRGELKVRPEIEFHADDADAALQLFDGLGFAAMLRFEKRRESYELGACEVCLDLLPQIGSFVEIEGPSSDAVRETRSKLELESAPLIQSSYAALIAQAVEAAGTAIDLRLPEND